MEQQLEEVTQANASEPELAQPITITFEHVRAQIDRAERIRRLHTFFSNPRCRECDEWMQPCERSKGFWFCRRCLVDDHEKS